MTKAHIKKGDIVVVLNGSHRGKRGKVLEMVDGRTRAIVEGVNLAKHHVKKNQEHPEGAVVEREAPLHASKLMVAERYDARRARRTSPAKA